MDLATKKRKAEENGGIEGAATAALTPADARKIVELLSREQLLDIVQDAACRYREVLEAVRANADGDPAQRKLFIRGLGWDTTADGLRSLFANYGELEEAVVIMDKSTGKSKGYGFITFRHIDGALLALKEPSKKIDGRMTVTQLAAAGASAQPPAPDLSLRKIYVGNVPPEMSSDRLLSHFLSYGEIEEGPLGFDKQTGKSRGFALFVYKNAEGARASLVDPTKVIDGHTMVCKLAAEGKKGKPGDLTSTSTVAAAAAAVAGSIGMAGQPPLQGHLPGQFGVLQAPPGFGHHQLNPSMGVPPLPSSIGGGGMSGYGTGLGGPYGSSQHGPPGSGGYGALSVGSSLYRAPPGSGGPHDVRAYGQAGFQPAGSSPGKRIPSGGVIYPGLQQPYF